MARATRNGILGNAKGAEDGFHALRFAPARPGGACGRQFRGGRYSWLSSTTTSKSLRVAWT